MNVGILFSDKLIYMFIKYISNKINKININRTIMVSALHFRFNSFYDKML